MYVYVGKHSLIQVCSVKLVFKCVDISETPSSNVCYYRLGYDKYGGLTAVKISQIQS